MENSNYGDLKISGSGKTGGGVYNNVSISGSGNVTGDVECNEFTISGSARVTGALKAKEVKVSGSAHITGEVTCSENFKVSGGSNLGGGLKCKDLTVMGDTHIGGDLTAEKVHVAGSVSIHGDCSAEEFNSEGCFKIDGLLNAGDIDVRLKAWGSRAREIGGEKIKISHSMSHAIGSFFKSIVTGSGFLLETGTIEGDEIFLEDTKAQVVRGVNVKIGSGCEVGLVEYSGTFEQIGNAVVKENKKI